MARVMKHNMKKSEPDRDEQTNKAGASACVHDASLTTLLAEIGRRLQVRFGKVEVVYHDGAPSPKILVEHRLVRSIE